ncbi:MAG: EamA family transporter [Eggerthellaceae bacterium]
MSALHSRCAWYVSKFSGTNDVLVLADAVLHRRRVRRGVRRASRRSLPRGPSRPSSSGTWPTWSSSRRAWRWSSERGAGACAARAGVAVSSESVFGVLFSVLLYGEQVAGLKLIVGFVLIFGAILVSEMFPLKRKDVAAINWKRCR